MLDGGGGGTWYAIYLSVDWLFSHPLLFWYVLFEPWTYQWALAQVVLIPSTIMPWVMGSVCSLPIWEYFNLGPTIMPPHHLLLENLSIELCCPLFIVLSNWVDGWLINLALWIPIAEFAWNVTMLLQYHCNGVCSR